LDSSQDEMSKDELFIIIAKLRDDHGEDFKRWYDQAAYPDVEDYCEIGFLISRFFEGSTSL
jgi:hypothetical protein